MFELLVGAGLGAIIGCGARLATQINISATIINFCGNSKKPSEHNELNKLDDPKFHNLHEVECYEKENCDSDGLVSKSLIDSIQ